MRLSIRPIAVQELPIRRNRHCIVLSLSKGTFELSKKKVEAAVDKRLNSKFKKGERDLITFFVLKSMEVRGRDIEQRLNLGAQKVSAEQVLQAYVEYLLRVFEQRELGMDVSLLISQLEQDLDREREDEQNSQDSDSKSILVRLTETTTLDEMEKLMESEGLFKPFEEVANEKQLECVLASEHSQAKELKFIEKWLAQLQLKKINKK